MKREFVITMKMQFVASHINDGRLPMEKVAAYLSAMLEGKAEVSSTRYMSARIVTESSEITASSVSEMVCAALSNSYGESEYNEIVSVREENAERSEAVSSEAEKADEEKSTEVPLSPLARRFAELAKKKKEEVIHVEKSEEEKAEQFENALCEVYSLVGCREFKMLCDEIVSVAPVVLQNGTVDAFSGQAYLFSINDGCGVSTVAQRFADLLDALGLKKMNGGVYEEKLDPPKNDGGAAFGSVERAVELCDEKSNKLFYIDVSEWMSRSNTRAFREFLNEIAKNSANCTIVFRIPFVEKSVLDKIHSALSEAMFVRDVCFPPFSEGELRVFAEDELSRYGYRLTSAAWPDLYERINEEKANGSFYGIKTVKKVVRELVYRKQLAVSGKGKNTFSLTKADTRALHSRFGADVDPYAMLDKMVCTEGLRTRIDEIVSQILMFKEDETVERPCIHMRFVGNPGTGKTTVARIVGKILKDKGVLRNGRFYEHHGRDFVGRYIGETAPKTIGLCRDAYGSVLFIDEAYSLSRTDPGDRDFGKEAIDTLIAEMENHRDDMVVIMAGYTDDMEKLMQTNSGLISRMPYTIEFPNFTREQLHEIFVRMLDGKRYEPSVIDAAKSYFSAMPEAMLNAKDFANGRFVRNLFERAFAKAATRCRMEGDGKISLLKEDFERATMDKEFHYEKRRKAVGFAE